MRRWQRGVTAILAIASISMSGCAARDAQTTEPAGPSQPGIASAPQGPETTEPWVATFDGFGPIKIGMTAAQVEEVAGRPLQREHYYNCTVLAAAPGADWRELSVWIDDSTNLVTGINTPQGTTTDRHVGDGSTVDEVAAAYTGFGIVERSSGGQGSNALRVSPANDAGGQYIFFALEYPRVGAPTIGRTPGQEGCAAATPEPPSATTAVPAGQSCGTYRNVDGVFDLVVVSGGAGCDEARSVFEKVDDGEITGAFVCDNSTPDHRTTTGVYRVCVYHDAQYELRDRTPGAGPVDCGPAPGMPSNHVSVQSGTVSCESAQALLAAYLQDPRTQRGDRGANVQGWNCGILGAAEAEQKGYVVACSNDTDKITVGPSR